MSEDYTPDEIAAISSIYESIHCGLTRKTELLQGEVEKLQTWTDRYIRKICELTGLDQDTVAKTEMDKFFSTDPITQLQIKQLTSQYKSNLEKEVHRSENDCREIDQTLDRLNEILLKSGRKTI